MNPKINQRKLSNIVLSWSSFSSKHLGLNSIELRVQSASKFNMVSQLTQNNSRPKMFFCFLQRESQKKNNGSQKQYARLYEIFPRKSGSQSQRTKIRDGWRTHTQVSKKFSFGVQSQQETQEDFVDIFLFRELGRELHRI